MKLLQILNNILAIQPETAIAIETSISFGSAVLCNEAKIPLKKVYLRSSLGVDSPYTYAVQAGWRIESGDNFLASQVWPSSRFAASSIEKLLPSLSISSICELGCGPGLPSIVAASISTKQNSINVIATDLDSFALELVTKAAIDQEITSLSTKRFDLTSLDELPEADLYVLSDVFETRCVALGSANHVNKALTKGKHVWVFAQSDRVQREAFLEELSRLTNEKLKWSNNLPIESNVKLWLCDVDELNVSY